MELMALPDGDGCECSKAHPSEANCIRFIFNALMTVIVAAAGFFLVCFAHILRLSLTCQIPDAPGMAKVFWMSNEDDRISRWRLDRVKKMPPTVNTERRRPLDYPADVQKLSWVSVKRTFGGWQLYIFTLSYAFWAWATNSNTWIILFLVSNTSHPQLASTDRPERCQKPGWQCAVFRIGDQCDSYRRIRTSAHRYAGLCMAQLKDWQKGKVDSVANGKRVPPFRVGALADTAKDHNASRVHYIIGVAGFFRCEDGGILLALAQQLWWTYPDCTSDEMS
jgi:hypothetical protein